MEAALADPRVVRRYASGLYAAASQYGVVDEFKGDLALVRRTVQENGRLSDALMGAVAPAEPKKRILRSLFDGRINAVTLTFLQVLVDHRRVDVIETIEASFRKVADERGGIVRATVSSAVPLSQEELDETRQRLSRITGAQVEIEQRLDETLIGGMVVRIGDRLIDGSVKGQLRQIAKALSGTP